MRKSHRRSKARPAFSVAPRIMRRANALVAALHRKKLTVVTAESCTGGLIAAALSQADGASDVLEGAFVTYTKEQKSQALGVPRSLLKKTGAVTMEVARRMVVGALKRSKAKIGVSITGVLGPKPDEDENPVGLVFIGCGTGVKRIDIVEKRFPRISHDQLRVRAVLAAFDLIEASLGPKR